MHNKYPHEEDIFKASHLFDEKGVEAAMETVDHLLSVVPVYLMKCRPDEESVALVEKVLFQES